MLDVAKVRDDPLVGTVPPVQSLVLLQLEEAGDAFQVLVPATANDGIPSANAMAAKIPHAVLEKPESEVPSVM